MMPAIAARTSSGSCRQATPHQRSRAVGEIAEHLAGKAAQQVAFVLEVDVEAGARNAGLGRQPIHAELGETGAVAHQPLGGVQQPALHLLAPLLARLTCGLRVTDGIRRA